LLVAQPHLDGRDEIACLLSLVPTFTPESGTGALEVVEDEKPEEEELAGKTMTKLQRVFIFLVDRSGSMEGRKMQMTKDALKLFL